MKKVFILCSILCVSHQMVFAQSTNISTVFHGNIKKADHYFNQYAYRNALTLYLHAFDRDSTDIYVQDQIADCYFKLHDPESAANWYARIIDKPGLHPEAKFEYAESLSMLGKYQEARHWYEQYLNDHPGNLMAKEKIDFIDNLRFYELDSLRFNVTNVDFNSSHSDYGAHYYLDGIVFASSRDLDYFIKHKPFDAVDKDESLLNMYYITGKVPQDHGEVEHLHRDRIKSALHEGPMAFYSKDTKAAYTRTNIKNGKPVYDKKGRAHLQIFFADVETLSGLKNIVPFKYNSDDYSVAHPSLSPDGSIMYFSSTAAGGFGGADIYYSTYTNGQWNEPVNLGPKINTAGDESFPHLANDSTLYFSSNGHGSLGGLDILVTYRHGSEFTKAHNFGGPLNSRFDDFSMVTDATNRVGYMASNRPGGYGVDDIYYYIATAFNVLGKIVAQDKTGAPIQGAAVYAVDSKTGKVLDADVTDAEGRYQLSVPFDQNVKIVAYRDSYELLKDQQIDTHFRGMGSDSLNMKLWKRDMFAKGNIYSNETQKPLTGVTAKIFDLKTNKVDSMVLTDRSDYTFLMRPDRKYHLEFTKPGYLKTELDLNTENLIQGVVTNDIVMHEESIESAIVYFDYDKSSIKEEAFSQMTLLIRTLRNYPMATVNIGAHADSRGGFEYNQRLSNDRANSVVQYLISKGISRKRITARGFGEKLLLNRCSDTVNCEEIDHSLNRRAEIKVQIKDNQKQQIILK